LPDRIRTSFPDQLSFLLNRQADVWNPRILARS